MPRKKKRNGAGLVLDDALDDDSIQTVIKMLANPLYPVDVVAFACCCKHAKCCAKEVLMDLQKQRADFERILANAKIPLTKTMGICLSEVVTNPHVRGLAVFWNKDESKETAAVVRSLIYWLRKPLTVRFLPYAALTLHNTFA